MKHGSLPAQPFIPSYKITLPKRKLLADSLWLKASVINVLIAMEELFPKITSTAMA
jgi:hypothetical protein